MNPLYVMLVVIGLLVLLLALVVLLAVAAQSRMDPAAFKEMQKLKLLLPKHRKERFWSLLSARLYPLMRRLPAVRHLLAGIHRRLLPLHAEQEHLVRAQAATVTLTVCAIVLGVWLLAFMLASSWSIRIGIMLAAVYMGSVVADLLIGRLEKKLLYGLSGLLLDMRHEYHQTHMVIEALERAAERTSPFVAAHAHKLAEVLASVDPEEELRHYYDEAPNRYTKLLAGISHMVSENGDGAPQKDKRQRGEGSLYLHALAKINEEIRMDILRREKLDTQLAGIVFVAFSPLFFIEPLKRWGENSFPVMADYYASSWGMYSLLILYALVGAGFVGLRLVRGLDGSAGADGEGGALRKQLGRPSMRRLTRQLMPPDYSAKHYRALRQIRDANMPLSVRELYVRKWLLAACAFVLIATVQLFMHDYARDRITAVPPPLEEQQLVTSTDYFEAERAALKSQIIREAIRMEVASAELIPYVESQAEGKSFVPVGLERDKFVQETAGQVMAYRSETYRWHELLVAFGIGAGAFAVPNLLLFFRRSMRKWEMQNETDGFTAIVSILAGLPRMSVIEILDWMHRYSRIFEPHLMRCLVDYESGPWQALERFKEEAKFLPLERIIDRLQASAELIPIKQAFDDIEQERAFDLEQRKLQYEQMIGKKVSIGKLIGFLPLQATFLLYLMVPFGYMAFNQLGDLSSLTGGL